MTVEMTCPHCGSPWMEGTGLFVCGEGTNGNVHGGCREYYTGKLIRGLYEQFEALRAALNEAADWVEDDDDRAMYRALASSPASKPKDMKAEAMMDYRGPGKDGPYR